MTKTAGSLAAIVALALAAGCGPSAPDAAAGSERANALREFWRLHDEAKSFYVAGRLSDAQAAYRAALERNPAHAGSLYAAAHVELLLHRHEPALALIERLKAADPLATKAWLLGAAVLSDPSPGAPFDLDAAAAEARQALVLNAEDSEVALVEGKIAWLRGDRARARDRFEASARTNPRNSPALLLLGALRLHDDDREGAGELFRRAEAAAGSAPPSARPKGEGDTAAAQAGDARARVLEARFGAWLASAAPEDGAARMAFSSPPDGPRAAGRLACGDLDGDGLPDLYATRSRRSPAVPAILRNAGGLRFRESAGPGLPRRIEAVLVADLDGDGAQDLADAGPSDGGWPTVRAWRNTGSGAFAPLELEVAPPTGIPTALAAVSLGRGRACLIVAFADRPPWTSLGTASGLEGAGPARAVTVLDFDQDGREDLVFATPAPAAETIAWILDRTAAGHPALRAFRGRGDGTFEPAPDVLPSFPAGFTWVAAGDVDGDGAPDLAAGCEGPEPWWIEPWYVLLNRKGAFEAFRAPVGPPLQPAAACLGDFDKNGSDEILLAVAGAEPLPLAIARRTP